jgi:hypothetical protein
MSASHHSHRHPSAATSGEKRNSCARGLRGTATGGLRSKPKCSELIHHPIG